MPRRLSAALAAITETLELEEASYVTLERIAALAEAHGVRSTASDLAWRLTQEGWLLPTPARGVWEFAPGAHAGPYGRGDDWVVLRASYDRHPHLDARVSLVSALWLQGLSERVPSTHEISGPATSRQLPTGLRKAFRYTRFDAHLPPMEIKGLPVETPATLLVHAAAHPTRVSSWDAMANALDAYAATLNPDDLAREIAGRSSTVHARLGYLLSGAAPDLVAALGLSRPDHTVRMGPYDPDTRSRYNAEWNIADSLLPFDPAQPAR